MLIDIAAACRCRRELKRYESFTAAESSYWGAEYKGSNLSYSRLFYPYLPGPWFWVVEILIPVMLQ